MNAHLTQNESQSPNDNNLSSDLINILGFLSYHSPFTYFLLATQALLFLRCAKHTPIYDLCYSCYYCPNALLMNLCIRKLECLPCLNLIFSMRAFYLKVQPTCPFPTLTPGLALGILTFQSTYLLYLLFITQPSLPQIECRLREGRKPCLFCL